MSGKLLLVVSLSVAYAACGPADRTDEAETGEVAAGAAPADAATDLRAVLMDPEAPPWRTAAPDTFLARFETTKGEFSVQVVRAWAPRGADRFYNLARHGFYDDSRFFRVVEGFIAQFGIPGDPEVTAAWRGRTLVDDPVVASNERGTLAYAFTEPDTRHTQIYINLVDNTQLDATGFAPFGRVTTGMDVVDGLYSGFGEDAGGGMRRGDQERMLTEGNAHLDRDFPELDHIVRIEVAPPPP
jgi:homoserine O-acetyltransferase